MQVKPERGEESDEKKEVKKEEVGEDGKPIPLPSQDQINAMLKKTQQMIEARKK